MTFPLAVDLTGVRQGSDFTRTFTWYTNAPAAPNWAGDWDPATAYNAQDVVRYSGNVYAATTATTGDTPTDGTPWLELVAVDLTGWHAAMMARRVLSDAIPELSLTDVLDSNGSGIVLGGAAGTVQVIITHATTALLPDAVLTYDLKLDAGAGNDTPFIAGTMPIGAAVTR